MKNLVSDMVQPEPSKRPKMDEVVSRFKQIVKSLSTWKLRSRIRKRSEFPPFSLVVSVIHLFHTVDFIMKSKPAIPSP